MWSFCRVEPLLVRRRCVRWTNFFLAYQGEDDRALQDKYARLTQAVIATRAPQWLEPPLGRAAGETRIRIGFASSFFRDCTAGRYFERWITDLPRDRFEVFVYSLHPTGDALTKRLSERADMFRHVQPSGTVNRFGSPTSSSTVSRA